MTSLKVHHRVRYRTTVEPPWVKSDHDARKVVKAVKKENFQGYVELRVGKDLLRFTQDNRQELVRVVCSDLGAKLTELCKDTFAIVPVPNREGVIGADEKYQTLRLAELIAKRAKAEAADSVRWREVRPKRHVAGGWRDPQVEYENLAVVELPRKPIVLFDDFLTSGSQLLATKRRLDEAGADVLFAITVGRAIAEHRDPMMGWADEEVHWRQAGFDF